VSAYADLAELLTFRPLERSVRCLHHPSPFSAPWTRTVALLNRELRMLAGRRVILQADFRESDLRNDGLPRADRQARSPGVVLAFESRKVGHSLRYEVGTYSRWQDNVRAIALGLESLRAVDRYGITRSGEQYAGWKQLASGGPSADRGRELIRRHGDVRQALKATHPDHGGDPQDFADVQAARGGVAL